MRNERIDPLETVEDMQFDMDGADDKKRTLPEKQSLKKRVLLNHVDKLLQEESQD